MTGGFYAARVVLWNRFLELQKCLELLFLFVRKIRYQLQAVTSSVTGIFTGLQKCKKGRVIRNCENQFFNLEFDFTPLLL